MLFFPKKKHLSLSLDCVQRLPSLPLTLFFSLSAIWSSQCTLHIAADGAAGHRCCPICLHHRAVAICPSPPRWSPRKPSPLCRWCLCPLVVQQLRRCPSFDQHPSALSPRDKLAVPTPLLRRSDRSIVGCCHSFTPSLPHVILRLHRCCPSWAATTAAAARWFAHRCWIVAAPLRSPLLIGRCCSAGAACRHFCPIVSSVHQAALIYPVWSRSAPLSHRGCFHRSSRCC